jgi:hypothetical protein
LFEKDDMIVSALKELLLIETTGDRALGLPASIG